MIYTYYNTKILNSYLLDKKEIKDLVKDIRRQRIKLNYPNKRTDLSYEKEIKAHILMYKLHLFRKHTKDTDLEEHIKKWKQIFYYMIGW